MDITAALVKMLPASVLPYLKFVVTVLGGAASSVVATYPGVDHRWVVAAAALTAISTYFTPNVQPVTVASTSVKSVDPESQVLTYGDDHPANPANSAATTTASTPVVEVPAAVVTPVVTPVEHVGV